MNTQAKGEDSGALTGVSNIAFGIARDILSLPGLHLLFCEGLDLPEVLPQTCQPHADVVAAPGHLR